MMKSRPNWFCAAVSAPRPASWAIVTLLPFPLSIALSPHRQRVPLQGMPRMTEDVAEICQSMPAPNLLAELLLRLQVRLDLGPGAPGRSHLTLGRERELVADV